MGAIGSLFAKFWPKKPTRVVMVGLDAAGKTTILFYLKMGETVMTNPTLGFNVEEVECENIKFTIWDVCGQGRMRQLWNHYYEGTHGVIFVIDCVDRDRLTCGTTEHCGTCAKCEFQEMLRNEHLTKSPVLIFANKQDIPSSAKPDEVARLLGLDDLPPTRKWKIQGCCALTGDGLREGLKWLGQSV
ncbi:putative ADP-ribosylation factor [Blattamonas nauphoetae]|uniref:ADP-ribosylation factor n=1 Tax=Blattamonas nauphoetae TaxID=2049346 RepID=A0ABQ9Y1R5_9EUKA|nr:putative ADP-ribosylation factor [Blattamonas nauphoetae]